MSSTRVNGGAPLLNQNTTYVRIGFGASTPVGTTVTAGATTPAQGNPVDLGVAPADLSAIYLQTNILSSTTVRLLISLSIDNWATILVENYYVAPNSGAFGLSPTISPKIPVNIPAGATVSAKIRSNANSTPIGLGLVGEVRNVNTRPAFARLKALNIDTTVIRPTPSVIFSAYNSLVWQDLLGGVGTTADYGALIAMPAEDATPPLNGGNAEFCIGVGAPPSGPLMSWMGGINNGSFQIPRGASPLIEAFVPSGSRLQAAVSVLVINGTDSCRFGVYGLAFV